MADDYTYWQSQNPGTNIDVTVLIGTPTYLSVVPHVSGSRIYITTITLSITTHVAADRYTFGSDVVGVNPIAAHTDAAAGAGVLSTVRWDFGPTGYRFNASSNLNVSHSGAGAAVAHIEGYYLPTPALTYSQQVLADGAVAYWRLDETSGTAVIDSAAVPHNGTYSGTFTLGVPGGISNGTAVDFGGTDGQGVVTGYTLTLIPQTSVEAWMWADTVDAGVTRHTISGRTTSYLAISAGFGKVYWSLDMNGGIQNILQGTIDLNVKKWYHIVGTFDGDKMRMYINGELNNTSASLTIGTGVRWSTGTFRIGAYDNTNPANFWDGKLDEVALYTTALTANQIREHYKARL